MYVLNLLFMREFITKLKHSTIIYKSWNLTIYLHLIGKCRYNDYYYYVWSESNINIRIRN